MLSKDSKGEDSQSLKNLAMIQYYMFTVGNAIAFTEGYACTKYSPFAYLCCLTCCCSYPQADNRDQFGQDALKNLDAYISKIRQDEKITMKTNKDEIKDEVRKSLAQAYNIKGHIFFHHTHYSGVPAPTLFSSSDAAANFKEAKLWDPETIEYESNYTAAIKYFRVY